MYVCTCMCCFWSVSQEICIWNTISHLIFCLDIIFCKSNKQTCVIREINCRLYLTVSICIRHSLCSLSLSLALHSSIELLILGWSTYSRCGIPADAMLRFRFQERGGGTKLNRRWRWRRRRRRVVWLPSPRSSVHNDDCHFSLHTHTDTQIPKELATFCCNFELRKNFYVHLNELAAGRSEFCVRAR